MAAAAPQQAPAVPPAADARSLCVAFLGAHGDGKSTLLGHLLVRTGAIDARRVDKEAAGAAGKNFAWVSNRCLPLLQR